MPALNRLNLQANHSFSHMVNNKYMTERKNQASNTSRFIVRDINLRIPKKRNSKMQSNQTLLDYREQTQIWSLE